MWEGLKEGFVRLVGLGGRRGWAIVFREVFTVSSSLESRSLVAARRLYWAARAARAAVRAEVAHDRRGAIGMSRMLWWRAVWREWFRWVWRAWRMLQRI